MSFWAVTSYFNPFQDPRRKANYVAFRKHLGLPLLTVEIVRRESQSDLIVPDADKLVRIIGDPMWQKERAYNVALRHLPPDCDKVLFLDADILAPEDPAWKKTAALLGEHAVVQPFGRVEYLRNDGTVDYTWPSIVSTDGKMFGQGAQVAMGNAWAFRRQFIQDCGFHDRFIVGGGDMPLVAALYGMAPEVVQERAQLNVWRLMAYRDWADRIRGAPLPVCAPVTIQHLWHGSEASRRYHDRKAILRDFNPNQDIFVPVGEGFRWILDGGPRVDAMALRIENYLHARAETP